MAARSAELAAPTAADHGHCGGRAAVNPLASLGVAGAPRPAAEVTAARLGARSGRGVDYPSAARPASPSGARLSGEAAAAEALVEADPSSSIAWHRPPRRIRCRSRLLFPAELPGQDRRGYPAIEGGLGRNTGRNKIGQIVSIFVPACHFEKPLICRQTALQCGWS